MSAWLRVVNAVLELAGDQAMLMAQTDAPWHLRGSTRHTVTLRFAGPDAVTIGQAFLTELSGFPDPPGHKVAEARALWSRYAISPAELVCQVELILIDDERAAA